MTNETKKQIAQVAVKYLEEKGLSQNEVATQTGINSSYLSQILREKFITAVDGKPVELGEKWFYTLAEFIDFPVNRTYWDTFLTPQFTKIIDTLESCKMKGQSGMIIGDTGSGKTYSVNRFCHKNPLHTFRITVNSSYSLEDIIEELSDKLGSSNTASIYRRNTKKVRLDKIVERLVEIKLNGGKPILIIDEGENMEISLLKTIKGLYDALKDNCAIVLLGTEKLVGKMLNKNGANKGRNREALPELYRRFKIGLRRLPPANKTLFQPFLDKYIEDKGARKLILDHCENFGELHDFIEPVRREAEETEQPLTEQLFRLYHDIPKY